jgi:hypothetical protein
VAGKGCRVEVRGVPLINLLAQSRCLPSSRYAAQLVTKVDVSHVAGVAGMR